MHVHYLNNPAEHSQKMAQIELDPINEAQYIPLVMQCSVMFNKDKLVLPELALKTCVLIFFAYFLTLEQV